MEDGGERGMLRKIISGGQTGADQAGLRVAKTLGFETGGWACYKWRTEAGQALWLAEYGLKECPEPGYSVRTKWNVRDSDATLIIGIPSAGSNLTQRFCGPQWFGKPWKWVPWPDYDPVTGTMIAFDPWLDYWAAQVHDWVYGIVAGQDTRDHLTEIETMNVAGNREEKNPTIGSVTERLLEEALVPF
jgi:hypothetical protein